MSPIAGGNRTTVVFGPSRSAGISKGPLLAALAAVAILLLSWSSSGGQCANTHVGDLVVQGNEVLLIDGTTYCQTGNIYCSDDARLVITNGTLVFNQRYHQEHMLYFSGNASLEITAGSIESQYACTMIFDGLSSASVADSQISGAQFMLHESAALSLTRSEALYVQMWDSSALNAEGTWITEVNPWAGGIATAEISGLRPGHLAAWDLRAESPVQDWGINIAIKDSTVHTWTFGAVGSSQLLFDDCGIRLDVRDDADVTVRNSDLEIVGLVFGPGQTIVLRNLRSGHLSQWSIEHGVEGYTGKPQLEIENCELGRFWNITNTGADLTVVGCELGYLWLTGAIGPVTTVESSTIDSLVFAGHYGTVRFSSTVVSWRFFPPSNGATRIEGGVKFLMDHLTFDEGEWHNATIVRGFPVSVVDASGLPLVGVALQLLSQSGEVVWSGETDAEGRADFEIAFGDTTYQDTWTLAVPSMEATRAVALLTESPIHVSPLSCDLNGDGETNVLDVRLVLQAALGLVHLTDDQLTVADVDGDGRVTLMDAEILAAKIIGSD